MANLIFSIVAAVAGSAAAWFAWRQRKDGDRARLAAVVEAVAEIKAAIEWGEAKTYRRDVAQRVLEAKLVGLDDLANVRALVAAELRADEPTRDLAARALAEARAALAKLD